MVQQVEGSTRPVSLVGRTQSEERYQAFIQNSSEGIWLFEIDEPISTKLSPAEQVRHMFKHAYLAEANLATAKMYGFESVDAIIGVRLSEFMIESDPENVAYLTAFVSNGYKLSNVESHELDNDGNEKYFRNSLTGIVEDGRIQRAWGTQQDITEQRRATEALKVSEERLTLALQASSMGFWEWDVVSEKLYWSDEQKRLFGLKPADDITYDRYVEMIHPEDRKRTQKVIRESMKTGGMYQFENRVFWPDGSIHWLQGKGRAYLEGGKPVRMVGTSTNIDERKRAELLALRQNNFLEMLHNSAVEASQSIDHQQELMKSILSHAGSICDTEHGYIYLLSNIPDELEVKLATGIFTEHMGHTIKKGEGLAGKVWQVGKPIVVNDYDSWAGRQPGFPKGLFKAAAAIPLHTGNSIIGVLALSHNEADRYFDEEQVSALLRLGDLASITLSNAQLLEELQESEQRFRTMADTAPVLIWLSGLDKGCTYFNKPWLNFTGRSMADEAGQGWQADIHPEDLERCNAMYETAFDKREPYSMEYRIRRHDGVYRWIVDKGVPRLSPTGEFQGYIGSCFDIDDMKKANELVVANAKLKNQQVQLMALNRTKDEFIALASHQLRTPATAVKQYTSLLIHEFAGPLTPEQLKYVKTAFDSNERQLQIISDLLKTAQIDSSRYVLEKKLQDISNIIKQAAKELRTTCEIRNQRLVLSGIRSLDVNIDANEIKLVLINLLENASKYSYPDSEIKLTMQLSSKYVELVVSDAGVGVSKIDAKRIFDKFTRVDNDLSDTVTGTGFGLYWVKRIVGLHGGSIKVVSEVGKGSNFIVRLPL